MNSQKLLFSTLCCLALTACATSTPLSSYSQAQVLEQDTNIKAYPSTTGNVAKLIKQDNQACMIEFTKFAPPAKAAPLTCISKSTLSLIGTSKAFFSIGVFQLTSP